MPKASGWVATRLRRLRAAGLRPRLSLIVLAAVIPALGLTLYTYLERRQQDIDRALADMQEMAQATASQYTRVLANTRRLLASTARFVEEHGRDAAGCSRFLSGLKEQYPEYANLKVTDAVGTVYCSAVPIQGPANVSDQAWFQRAVRTRGFALGDFMIGRITGVPVISASLPIVDRTGDVVGVAEACLDLLRLARMAASARMPEGFAVLLIDSKGTVLARHPDHEKWVGRSLQDAEIARAMLTGRAAGMLMPSMWTASGVSTGLRQWPVKEERGPCTLGSASPPPLSSGLPTGRWPAAYSCSCSWPWWHLPPRRGGLAISSFGQWKR